MSYRIIFFSFFLTFSLLYKISVGLPSWSIDFLILQTIRGEELTHGRTLVCRYRTQSRDLTDSSLW